MSEAAPRTRFAPSPTGALHLGSVRTALFNWLAARAGGGHFVLRCEDTDAERSDPALLERLHANLAWLGLGPDEGPLAGGAYGPYCQSERDAFYREALARLDAGGHTYPCYCTREELADMRRRQLAAGEPPRYPGTCRHLDAGERAEREAAGRSAAIRFRVPDAGEVAFDDRVLGRQVTRLGDVGDFIIARSDGSPAFFLANAVDDAHMAITDVLRGEDHLTNTPRQLLLLEALGLAAPRYGHFGLILDRDHRPLSKRRGGATLDELRAAGFRPEAIVNHLARIGFAPGTDALMDGPSLAAAFVPGGVAHGGACHDPAALAHWQRKAVDALDAGALWRWLEDARPPDAVDPPVDGPRFAEAVRPNILCPADAWAWAARLFDPEAGPDDRARAEIAAAGPTLFRSALAVGEPAPAEDFRGWAAAVGRAAGVGGRALFRPLRAALTNAVDGPELATVVPMIPEAIRRQRLAACAAD